MSLPNKCCDFERLQWSFPFAVTIHNLEEAIWLPSWAARHSTALPWHISAIRFRISVAALTAAAYAVTWLSLKRGRESLWTYIFASYTLVMFLNVFVPHIPATVLFKSYTPGVFTAALVNLPITTGLLVCIFRERIITTLAGAVFIFGIPLGMATIAAVLFAARLQQYIPVDPDTFINLLQQVRLNRYCVFEWIDAKETVVTFIIVDRLPGAHRRAD